MFKYGKKKPQGATRHNPKTNTAPTPKSVIPSWLLVGFGITVGLFVASGLYWWQPWQPVATAKTAPTTDANGTTAANKAKAGEPKFVFYDLLPNQEVLTQPAPTQENKPKTTSAPTKSNEANTAKTDSSKEQLAKEKLLKEKHDKSIKEQKAAKEKALALAALEAKEKALALAALEAKEPPKDSGRYALQAGSFKSKAEADRHRATIMLAGLPVKVQKVTIKAGEEWYRVVVGPFTGKDNATAARKNLQREGVDSLVVKQD